MHFGSLRIWQSGTAQVVGAGLLCISYPWTVLLMMYPFYLFHQNGTDFPRLITVGLSSLASSGLILGFTFLLLKRSAIWPGAVMTTCAAIYLASDMQLPSAFAAIFALARLIDNGAPAGPFMVLPLFLALVCKLVQMQLARQHQ